MFYFLKKSLFRGHILSFFIIACYVFIAFQQVLHNSITYDEPAHIRSGLEWLTTGYSPSDPLNPPLPKIIFGLLQFAGVKLLSDPYLVVARGISIGVASVFFFFYYFWVKKEFSSKIALLSLLFLVCEPGVIAYTHLATTETMTMVIVFLVFVCAIYSIQKVMTWRLFLFLFSLQLLFFTKTIFLLASFPLLIIVLRKYMHISLVTITRVAICQLFLFAVLEVCLTGGHAYPVFFHKVSFPGGGILHTSLTAVNYVSNAKYDSTKSMIFFGKVGNKGSYLYSFVSFFLKTSPQMFILFLVFLLFQYKTYKGSQILSSAIVTVIAIFAVTVIGNYNVGQRHIIAIFPFLAIFAALALEKITNTYKKNKIISSLIMALCLISLFIAITTQDTIAYITPFVGQNIGGNIVGDSNFDWGQSLPVLIKEKYPIDYIAASTIIGIVPYGMHAKILSYKTPKNLLKGKNVFISRTVYFKEGFYKDTLFQEKNAQFVANGTYLRFFISK